MKVLLQHQVSESSRKKFLHLRMLGNFILFLSFMNIFICPTFINYRHFVSIYKIQTSNIEHLGIFLLKRMEENESLHFLHYHFITRINWSLVSVQVSICMTRISSLNKNISICQSTDYCLQLHPAISTEIIYTYCCFISTYRTFTRVRHISNYRSSFFIDYIQSGPMRGNKNEYWFKKITGDGTSFRVLLATLYTPSLRFFRSKYSNFVKIILRQARLL